MNPTPSTDSTRFTTPRRILVPVDFSPSSESTARFAREWAARFDAEICLLHVIEPISTVGAFGTEPIAAMLPIVDFHEQARAALAKFTQAHFPAPLRVSVHLRDGSPWDRIAVAAGELDADLIIISTHGRTGLSHALLGSNAERVVRHAPCPVLTLRGPA